MKIIALLEHEVTSGGGFNQATNAILQMQRICKGRFKFEVCTTHPKNLSYLSQYGLITHIFKNTLIDKLITMIYTCRWWQTFQTRYSLITPLEKMLLNNECDLVYFVTPGDTARSLKKLNHITTVWDLCHLDEPIFPEIRLFNEFFNREDYYKNSLDTAFLILTDSEQLTRVASFRYGINPDRFLSMPFAPSPFLANMHCLSEEEVLKKYCLHKGYFFYPAQFWAHKNHIRILEALLLLRDNHKKYQIVFSGKDFGNRKYLENFVFEHNLQSQVTFLGFVPSEDIYGLYKNALAVVMPTYFGPTNLPPLEAWSLNKPLIYSSHLADQAGNAALLVDPDSADELAKAMIQCDDPAICNQLIEAGKQRLKHFEAQRAIAEDNLIKKLEQFAAQRRCWH